MKALFQSILLVLSIFYLMGCSGGSDKSHTSVSSASLPASLSSSSESSSADNSSASSSISVPVSLSGVITFDWIPHKVNHLGLDYSNVEVRPARGVLVELLNSSDNIIAVSTTNASGEYHFVVEKNQQVSLRVKAVLKDFNANMWDISVRDNTQSNALYAVQGSLTAITTDEESRNIHIDSGWNGTAYSINRGAAPFAILDALYQAIEKLKQIKLSKTLPAFSVYWSEKNTTAEGDIQLGEIGTSYYSNGNIYLLGDADVDTDEYDAHVILHEWTHYLEDSISRSDSLGGDHGGTDKLDMRVAFSEGLANAFSGIMLDDSYYQDAVGLNQASGFYFNLAEKSQNIKGWYSQGSIGAIVFNYYLSSTNRIGKSAADLLATFTRDDYVDSPEFVSIFLFSEILQKQSPDSFNTWLSLLQEQNIHSFLADGEGETNAGGYVENLPLFKALSLSNPNVSLCSSNRFGSLNKLSNYQYVKIDINQAGTYRFKVTTQVGMNTDPDLYLYSAGNLIKTSLSALANEETMDAYLTPSTYILSLAEAKVLNDTFTNDITYCFSLNLTGVGE